MRLLKLPSTSLLTMEFEMSDKQKRPSDTRPDGRPQVNERNLPPMQIKVPMPPVKPTKKD